MDDVIPRLVGAREAVLLVAALGALAGPAPLAGQEADVRAAIEATLEAWTAGDFDAFAAQYHADVKGFFLDGSPLAAGFDVAALRMAWEAGMRTRMQLRDLDVRVYGGTAVSAGYLDGSIALPGGEQSISGTWRYSETRISVGGRWKVVQYHFSQLAGGR